MVECPKCHLELKEKDLIKSWSATPRAGPNDIHVTINYWQCPNVLCAHKFRTATRTWPSKKKGILSGLGRRPLIRGVRPSRVERQQREVRENER